MADKAIVYNYQKQTSFIQQDKESLEDAYHLMMFSFDPKSNVAYFLCIFKQIYFLLANWRKYDVIVSQIAAYHTFIPSILSRLNLKKHVIILHGTDCNVIPEIIYGNLGKWPLCWFTKKSLQMATLLLPVSYQLIENDSNYLSQSKARFGLKNNITKFKTPIHVIFNGLDNSIFKIKHVQRIEFSFLTVALDLGNHRNYLLKGIDLILDLAKKYPKYKFSIIGSDTIYGYNGDLPNVNVIGKVNHVNLPDIYNQHRFYLQLSMSESFGLSLCEAIMCGCIPVVSDVGMMAEIVGHFGYVLKEKDQKPLEQLINLAIDQNVNDNIGLMEKRRISVIERFDHAIRKKALIEVINKLTL